MLATLYTLPNCVQCKATKRKMTELGVPHETVDVSEDHEARDFILSLGYSAAPVVVAGREQWQGYRPERIASLIAAPTVA